jgi:hypothetical protein
MRRHLSTCCLPLLALVIAVVLISHDAAMAAGPHDGGHGSPHGDHGPVERTACGELEVARTSDPPRDVAAAAAMPPPAPALPNTGADAPPATAPDPGAPPGQIRAMLQIWLN